MNKLIAAAITVAVLALSAPANAQSYIWVGAGPSIPIGDTKDGLKSGFLATAGVGFGLGSGDLSLQVEGNYGSSNFKVGSGKMTLLGGFVNLECEFNKKAKLRPYLYAGGGIINAKPEGGESDSKAAFQGGAGIALALNTKWTLWSDARYLSTTGDAKLTLLPVTIGLSWAKGAK